MKNRKTKLMKIKDFQRFEKQSFPKLQKNILKKIVSTLKKYGINKAGIFGSYARGEAKKKSDIDILIKPPKGMGLEFVGVNIELEEKLGKKVHLVTYNSIHPLLKERILKEEVKII